MSAYFATDDRIAFVGNLNLGAGAETLVYATGKPIDVKRLVLVMTAAQATAGAVLTVSVRNVDDSSSTTIGTATTPAVMAVNGVFKVDIANVKTAVVGTDASQSALVTTGRVLGRQENQPGVIEVNPGQEFVVASGGEGDTGAADLYIEYVEVGNNPLRFNATDIVFTHA